MSWEETEQAIRDAENGVNIKTFPSIEELIEELESE